MMIKEILFGISEYNGALQLMRKLNLWKYFVIPILISVLTAVFIGIEAYVLADNVGAFIAKIWTWEVGKQVVQSISNFIGGIIVLALGIILYKHIVMAFSAPFMSVISEKIEKSLYGDVSHLHRKTTFLQQLVRGIRINIRNLAKELLLTLPILMLKFIPIVNIFSTLLLFLVQAYYAGFGNMDYTLERHFKYRSSVDFVRKNRGFAIGNGIIFMLFLLIPIVGIIIVFPISVTAATKKTLRIIHEKNQTLQYEK